MDRRVFIRSLAALAGAGITLGPDQVRALLRCQDNQQMMMRQCEAGISSQVLQVNAAAVGGQHMSQWCWAACIEMIFRYYGFIVPQERIVRETWGQIYNQPADAQTILKNLNRPWIDDQGRRFMALGDVYSVNVVTAAQDLSNDMPLIIGTMGHAMVLTSMVYHCFWNGVMFVNCGIDAAIVRDPWPGHGRRNLSPEEWTKMAFAARVRLQPA
ncbi:MAG: papain-like cysteine protease family protein [Thermodesulfobacteriota bacterium]